MTAQEFEKAVCRIHKDLKEYKTWCLKYDKEPYCIYYNFGHRFNKRTNPFYCVPGEWQDTFKAIKEIFEKEGYKVNWWQPEKSVCFIFYTLCISWN